MTGYVLVVDDDADLRTMMAVELSRSYVVVEADGEESALEQMRRHGAPHAVVSDLHLGTGGRGDALLAAVRSRHPRAARILVSGSPGSASAGAPHAILAKPWTRGRLLATVALCHVRLEQVSPTELGLTPEQTRADAAEVPE